jgi:hypothetical protein
MITIKILTNTFKINKEIDVKFMKRKKIDREPNKAPRLILFKEV